MSEINEGTREEREFQIRLSEIETNSEYLGNYAISLMFAGFVGFIAIAIEYVFNTILTWVIIFLTIVFVGITIVGLFINNFFNRNLRRAYQELREEYGLSRNEEG